MGGRLRYERSSIEMGEEYEQLQSGLAQGQKPDNIIEILYPVK